MRGAGDVITCPVLTLRASIAGKQGRGKVVSHLEAAAIRAWSPHIFFQVAVLIQTLWRGRHFCRFSPVIARRGGIETRTERIAMGSIGVLLAAISAIAMLAVRNVGQARMAPARQKSGRQPGKKKA